MHDHRSGRSGIHPSHSLINRVDIRLSGNRQHSGRFGQACGGIQGRRAYRTGRFVYHQQRFVFIHDFQFRIPVHIRLQRIFLDVETLQHMLQDRSAFSFAGRIIISMTADLVFRRISPPEFSHSKRLPTAPVGILQKLGSRTLTCTCRWCLLDGIFKQVAQIPFLSAGVQHAELFEKPLLKGSRTGLAFCFEAFDFRLEHFYFRLEGGKVIFPILFLPF